MGLFVDVKEREDGVEYLLSSDGCPVISLVLSNLRGSFPFSLFSRLLRYLRVARLSYPALRQ